MIFEGPEVRYCDHDLVDEIKQLRAAARLALKALAQCGLDDTARNYDLESKAEAALRAALGRHVTTGGTSDG